MAITISRKDMQALSISMDVRPCAVGLMEAHGITGFAHGSAWNSRLYPWKHVHSLEFLEAHRNY